MEKSLTARCSTRFRQRGFSRRDFKEDNYNHHNDPPSHQKSWCLGGARRKFSF